MGRREVHPGCPGGRFSSVQEPAAAPISTFLPERYDDPVRFSEQEQSQTASFGGIPDGVMHRAGVPCLLSRDQLQGFRQCVYRHGALPRKWRICG